MSGPGSLRNYFSGNIVCTNYLLANKQGQPIKCGPLQVPSIQIDGTVTSVDPPTVDGPNHAWLPLGPAEVDGSANHDFTVPIPAEGTWSLHIYVAGTGTSIGNFAHYDISASVTMSGTTVAVEADTVDIDVTEKGTLVSSPPPAPFDAVTLVGGIAGALTIRVHPAVLSNWTAYVYMVGAEVATI